MAKIKLTRRTFSATVSKMMDNAEGLEGMFAKALMGKTVKECLSEQPDNQTLWVDTDKVVCVTDLTEETTTHDIVFGIMFQFQPKISDIVWIDGKDFDAFMKAWKELGEQPPMKNGIIINGVEYELIEDREDDECERCALSDICHDARKEVICNPIFGDLSISHRFEKRK